MNVPLKQVSNILYYESMIDDNYAMQLYKQNVEQLENILKIFIRAWKNLFWKKVWDLDHSTCMDRVLRKYLGFILQKSIQNGKHEMLKVKSSKREEKGGSTWISPALRINSWQAKACI